MRLGSLNMHNTGTLKLNPPWLSGGGVTVPHGHACIHHGIPIKSGGNDFLQTRCKLREDKERMIYIGINMPRR